jgi:hypothetical protein
MGNILGNCLEARKNELAVLLNELDEARTEDAQVSDEWKAAYEAWYKEHNALGLKMEAAQRKEFCLATRVREKTLELFFLTGSKKPVEGVAIKDITKVSYDENSIRLWAIEGKHFDFLCLEKKGFDAWAKKAKAGTTLPLTCKVEKVPRAEIAGKL